MGIHQTELTEAGWDIEMGEADRLFEFLDRDDSGSLSIVESFERDFWMGVTTDVLMKRPKNFPRFCFKFNF